MTIWPLGFEIEHRTDATILGNFTGSGRFSIFDGYSGDGFDQIPRLKMHSGISENGIGGSQSWGGWTSFTQAHVNTPYDTGLLSSSSFELISSEYNFDLPEDTPVKETMIQVA